MQVVSASTIFALPLKHAAALLAACPTFQAVVGEATADGAKRHILHPYAEDELDENGALVDRRPRAILSVGTKYQLKNHGAASWADQGSISMALEVLSDADRYPSRRDQEMAFLNSVGGILDEMKDLSGMNLTDLSGTYLNVEEFALTDGPGEAIDADEEESFYAVEIELHWRG